MPSIYQRICAEYQKNRSLPYAFMPADIGATSVVAMKQNEMPRALREVCARKTWAAVLGKGPWSIIEPVWYAQEFRQELLNRIEAGEITREEAARRGMSLAMNSDAAQGVEAGMLMMGMNCDDMCGHVMERLALHSKFTMIGIVACQDWPEPNRRIFRWLQNTQGCGNTVCAMALRPEDDEQRRWLFFHAMRAGSPAAEAAHCILMRPSMAEYIRSLPDDADTFHALCRLACYIPQADAPQHRWLIVKMLQGLHNASQFIDLCAIHRVQRILLQPDDELYDEWMRLCDPIRWKLRRQGLIERQLDDPKESAELLALVLNGERMTPPLERLTRILAAQELPVSMLRFLLLEHGDIYAERLLELMLQVSPKVLFTDPPTVRDVREYPEGQYDRWLGLALGCMDGDPALEESVAVKCLSARSVAVRAAAVRCLDSMCETPLPQAVEQALRQAMSQEPDAELRKRMQLLIHGMNRITFRRCRVNLPGIDTDALRSCEVGPALKNCEILSRNDYNSDGVRDLLREGERLLLTARPNDADTAWAVTPGGVVIGEVALEAGDNLLRDCLEAGEPLAVVLEGNMYMEHLWAEIRRPLHPLRLPDTGVIRSFPGKI